MTPLDGVLLVSGFLGLLVLLAAPMEHTERGRRWADRALRVIFP